MTLVIETPTLDEDDVEDLEEAPDNEVEAAEEQILDQATAARTITELKAEIETLKQLEALALAVRRSGTDRKWRELANLLSEIFSPTTITGSSTGNGANGDAEIADLQTVSAAPKLVVFTEHRDDRTALPPASRERGWDSGSVLFDREARLPQFGLQEIRTLIFLVADFGKLPDLARHFAIVSGARVHLLEQRVLVRTERSRRANHSC